MKKLLPILVILTSLFGCYPVKTTSHYNKGFTRAHTQSEPIYLSFRDAEKSSFYFILSRDTNHTDYKLRVRWHSANKDQLLFKGQDSTLKFLVNKEKILSFQPINKPKVVAYNMNKKGREEEAQFSLTQEEFYAIAYAKEASVELTGRYISVVGHFNRRNNLKPFRDFAENSH